MGWGGRGLEPPKKKSPEHLEGFMQHLCRRRRPPQKKKLCGRFLFGFLELQDISASSQGSLSCIYNPIKLPKPRAAGWRSRRSMLSGSADLFFYRICSLPQKTRPKMEISEAPTPRSFQRPGGDSGTCT